jgi:hypothetical protein
MEIEYRGRGGARSTRKGGMGHKERGIQMNP